MDAPVHGRYRHAFLAPFMRADDRQQFAQRYQGGLGSGRAIGFLAGSLHVLRPTQRHPVICRQLHQHPAQPRGPLPLLRPVPGKGFPGIPCRLAAGGMQLPVGQPAQRLHEMARPHPVAMPQQGDSLLYPLQGLLGRQVVAHQLDLCVWRYAGFGTPASLLRIATPVLPADQGRSSRE